jgi:hypothetical protein
LPRSLPGRPSLALALRVAACTLACVVGASSPVAAFQLAVDPPHVDGDFVWADLRFDDLFDGRVAQSLQRGMPATLQLRAELWRKRTAWFDRVERTFEGSIRIRYEVWRKTYRVERADAPPRMYGSLDSVRIALARSISLPVARREQLSDGPHYYVVVTATVRPLSVEDVEEVEGWLSGEVQSGRGSSIGLITALPRALFDAVRNLSGFGDEQVRAVSPDFTLQDLERGQEP